MHVKIDNTRKGNLIYLTGRKLEGEKLLGACFIGDNITSGIAFNFYF